MFGFFFRQNKDLSNNSRKVKKWQAEHRALANQAVKVVEAYDNDDKKKARKHLNKLQDLALKHLMDEDVTFYELFKKAEKSKSNEKIIQSMQEFRKSFIDTKKALFYFFIFYTDEKNPLDEVFKEKLDGIIAALVSRIEFEESNLYILINN